MVVFYYDNGVPPYMGGMRLSRSRDLHVCSLSSIARHSYMRRSGSIRGAQLCLTPLRSPAQLKVNRCTLGLCSGRERPFLGLTCAPLRNTDSALTSPQSPCLDWRLSRCVQRTTSKGPKNPVPTDLYNAIQPVLNHPRLPTAPCLLESCHSSVSVW
jgi:hypothetical protein